MNYLLKNFKAVNEGKVFEGQILLKDGLIEKIYNQDEKIPEIKAPEIKYFNPASVENAESRLKLVKI